jgi:hypothetical protein
VPTQPKTFLSEEESIFTHVSRTTAGCWPRSAICTDIPELQSVACRIALAGLYEKIDLTPTA